MATFGKTTDGTNVQTFSGDRIYLSTATPSTSGTDTQASDSTVTGTTSVTSFSNASLDAGDYLRLKTTSVSGTPDWLHVTIYYTIN